MRDLQSQQIQKLDDNFNSMKMTISSTGKDMLVQFFTDDLTVFLGFMLNYTAWGRHLYAIGSNENAATMTGVPVKAVKMSAYLFCSLTAGMSAIMIVGWMGSVTNALGMIYELRVIASAVIGGADLMGGVGSAYGALIGSFLVELIRNGLLMAGVDPYWQGTFVGLFIIFAVALEKIRSHRSS